MTKSAYNITIYTLHVIDVSGDIIKIHTQDRDRIFTWLRGLDHEGSRWRVAVQDTDDWQTGERNITPEIETEYAART
jgi:hypothetical protein